MTEQEQRIAIAEACGWKWCRVNETDHTSLWQLTKRYEKSGVLSPGTYFSVHYEVTEQTPPFSQISDRAFADNVPDYLHDLNAMHEAEKTLDESQRTKFYWELAKIVLGDNVPLNCTFLLVHATAAQRAKAFLRTLGKWSSSPLRESE